MNWSSLDQFRPVLKDTFLRVTADHETIAGTQASAITYAAVERMVSINGPGDTLPMEVTLAEIIDEQGVLKQNRKTVMQSLSVLVKRGVIVPDERRGRDNRYRFRLNRETIANLLGCERSSENGLPEVQNGTTSGPETDNPPIRRVKNLGKEPNPVGSEPSPLQIEIRELLAQSTVPIRDTWEVGGTVPSLEKALAHAPVAGLLWLREQLVALGKGYNVPRSWAALVWRCRRYMKTIPSETVRESVPAADEVEPEVEKPDEWKSLAWNEIAALRASWKSCPEPGRKPAAREQNKRNDCHGAAQGGV